MDDINRKKIAPKAQMEEVPRDLPNESLDLQQSKEGDQEIDELRLATKGRLDVHKKYRDMAAVLHRALSMSQKDLVTLEEEDLINRLCSDCEITKSQRTLVASRINIFKQHLDFAKQVKSVTKEGKDLSQFFGEGLLKESAGANAKLDFPIEIVQEIGNLPSHIVLVFNQTDYIRLLSGESRSWSEIPVEEQASLSEYYGSSAGTNLDYYDGNITVINGGIYKDRGKAFVSTVLHEEMHYLQKIFGLRADFFNYEDQAIKHLTDKNYEGYLHSKLMQQINYTKDEIIAYLTDEDNYNSPSEISKILNSHPYYNKTINEAFNPIEDLLDSGEIETELWKRLSLIAQSLRDTFDELLEQSLVAASDILKAKNGYELLILTPLEEWSSLAKNLSA